MTCVDSKRSSVIAASSVISVIASVGQVSAQAPQETHVESRKPASRPAVTLAPKPRPVAVRANAPWTSSQARTQRPQEMHSSCWNARYGWRSSWSAACVGAGPARRRRRRASARPCASSVCGAGATGSSESTSSTIAVDDATRGLVVRCRSPCPSRHGVVHAGSGPRAPATPTRQTRQAPNGAWRGSKQSVGTSPPARADRLEHRRVRLDLDARARRS